MSAPNTGHPSGVVFIDGLPYFLARVPDTKNPMWKGPVPVPTQDGDPSSPQRARFSDWSRGIGDSRGMIPGAVEYAEYAFLPLGKVLPGPLVTEIASVVNGDITCFQDVTLPATRILVGGGTQVAEINPSTMANAVTNTLAGSVMGMALVNDQVAIALGDSTTFRRRNASGTYSAATVTGNNRFARAFGISGSTLVKGGPGNSWQRCINPDGSPATDFYGTDANWSAEYDVGDMAGNANQVFGHNRWDYILKDEGLYTFDEPTNSMANSLEDLRTARSSENRWYFRWYDLIFVCSIGGLYRYLQQGAARLVGIEEVQLNESELSDAYPTAGVAFGKYAYVAYYRPSTGVTYICMMRRAEDGDASIGSPFTIITIIDKFTGDCRAMHVTGLGGTQRLLWAKDASVRYIQLTRDGRPAAYTTTQTVVRMAPSDLGSPMTMKSFTSIEVIARLGTSDTIQLQAAIDGGSANNVGAAISSLTAGYAQRFWTQGSNDVGRSIQPILLLNNSNANATPAEIREVVVNYEERPQMTVAYEAVLRMNDYQREGDYSDSRTAAEARNALLALVEGAAVSVTGPDGETFTARVGYVAPEIAYQLRGDAPQEQVAVQLRRVDYS
jgi:hypothetical protein